jgi:dihydroorotase
MRLPRLASLVSRSTHKVGGIYTCSPERIPLRSVAYTRHTNKGVTTNSEAGVTSFDDFYPTFAAMEKHDMVLNLHGEVPGVVPEGKTHEEAFLPTLKRLHEKFPKLRIILEHCSTAAALDAVRACGPTVGATITAHHLYLTGDVSQVDSLAFCKPIPKTPADRDALLKAVVSGDPKFFL